MKIIVTENQYKNILKENRLDKFMGDFIDKHRNTKLDEVINELFFQYGFSIDVIAKVDKLKNYFSDRLGVKINLDTSVGKLDFINKLNNFAGYRFADRTKDFLENVLQGMMDEVIDEVLSEVGGDFRKATKKLSILHKLIPRFGGVSHTFFDEVKRRAEEEGYTIVRKPNEWTFEKGGGRIQSVIDYIRSTEKKTRGGWQRSVGKDPNKWRSWNSRMWGAMLAADIIRSNREGKDIVYTLGPNAEAFEQGKLIGF